MPVGHLGRRNSWRKWRGGFSENGGGVARKSHKRLGVDGRVSLERNSEVGRPGWPSQPALSACFDPAIADLVKTSIATNAMTPSVAGSFVTQLAEKRAAFLGTVEETRKGLKKLRFVHTALAPGHADMSFLIPRDLFDNNLDDFVKELSFISRLVQDVHEGITGTREKPQLESLSSSIPTITVEGAVAVVAVLAKVVDLFLNAWKKIEEIRATRDKLTELGFKGTATEELNEHVTTIVEEVVEESRELVLKSYITTDGGRKNELGNAISSDFRRLFGQIEQGLTIEFRAQPPTSEEAGSEGTFSAINTIANQLQFPPPAKQPLLLVGAEILEGELHKKTYKKTTTTTTTSTTKKAAKKT
jgi:hypothetical protein